MADGAQEEILRRWRLTMEDTKAALATGSVEITTGNRAFSGFDLEC
jgi:hypothetical protein